MDKEKMHLEIEQYIESLNSDSKKTKNRKDLTCMLDILSERGHETPDESDYQEFAKRQKDKTQKATRERESRVKKFIEYRKGVQQMTINTEDNTITTEEATTQEIETKTLESSKTSTEDRAQVVSNPVAMDNQQTRTPGRPKSTDRSAKFTLYMTESTMKSLTLLADYDEMNITDLVNNILTDYLATRQDDLEFLNTLEQKKQERRLARKGNDR